MGETCNNHDVYVLFQWLAICKLGNPEKLKEYFKNEERCALFEGPIHFETEAEADAFSYGLYYSGIGNRGPMRYVILRMDCPEDIELINICLESKYGGVKLTEEPVGPTVNMKFIMEDNNNYNSPFGFTRFHVPMTRQEYELVRDLMHCISSSEWAKRFDEVMTGNDRFLQIVAPEIYKRMRKCASEFVAQKGHPELIPEMRNWNFYTPDEMGGEETWGSPFDPDYDDTLDDDDFE